MWLATASTTPRQMVSARPRDGMRDAIGSTLNEPTKMALLSLIGRRIESFALRQPPRCVSLLQRQGP